MAELSSIVCIAYFMWDIAELIVLDKWLLLVLWENWKALP